MDFIVFHFTLFMLLSSILTSAACLSAYLVSRRQLMLIAAVGFLFYFFDIAWVFQDNILAAGHAWRDNGTYLALRSVATLVSGVGFISSFWLLVCAYLGGVPRAVKLAPCVVFCILSIVALVAVPENNLERFAFYTMRALFLFWMLIYAGVRYLLQKNESERARLRRAAGLYLLLWVLGVGVVVEDALYFLVPGAGGFIMDLRAVAPERNYCENALVLCCMVVACRSAFKALSLRFENPPVRSSAPQEEFIEDNLPYFSRRYQLSPREQEIMREVLRGKDNQNIASELHLSLSTVKVHVHNILQKTGLENRKALIREFWKDA